MSSSQTEYLLRESSTVSDWHAKEIHEVLSLLGVSEHGLSAPEIIERRKKYGTNSFTKKKKESLVVTIYKQLRSPLAIVLVVAFFLTLAFQEFIDAGVIAFALAIAVVVGVLQEGKASRAFDTLASSQVKMATVYRNGGLHQIEASELVPGDIVQLSDGGQVPADMRLLKTKKLAINEAAMTGEWLAVNKSVEPVAVGAPFAERYSMAWMGTFVSKGSGSGVVVATGDTTEVGSLAEDIDAVEDPETPLQKEMERVSRIMLIIISVLVVLIFIIGIIQGQSVTNMLLTAIAIAVASVPEGLPAAVTIILAVGMEALLKRGGLVRNLLAAETLGSTTYVLTDKTGTLTQAKMAVAGIIHSERTYHGVGPKWKDDIVARDLFDTALCATAAFIDVIEEENKSELRGDPVETSILESAHSIDINMDSDTARGRRIDYLAFTSENRFAAGLTPYADSFRLCVNGAPEYLLEFAESVRTSSGVAPLTDEVREQIESEIEVATKEGKRLVGVGYRAVNYTDIPEQTEGYVGWAGVYWGSGIGRPSP